MAHRTPSASRAGCSFFEVQAGLTQERLAQQSEDGQARSDFRNQRSAVRKQRRRKTNREKEQLKEYRVYQSVNREDRRDVEQGPRQVCGLCGRSVRRR